MKKILVAIMAVLFAAPSFAQYSSGGFSLDGSSVYYGLRLGLNFSGLSTDPDADLGTKTGMTLAGIAGLRLSDTAPVFLESGLYYTQLGAKKDKITHSLNYLEIPVLIKYGVQVSDDIALLPYVGPYFSYGIGGKVKYPDPTGKVGKHSSFNKNYYKHPDMGFKIGCGAEYNMLYLELGYKFGVANIAKDPAEVDASAHNHALYLNLGVNF